MSGRHEALLALLADGALHSGADLAAALGVSRAAVWKLVGELRRYGVPLWLFRQYNPLVDLQRVQPGTRVQIPLLAAADAS